MILSENILHAGTAIGADHAFYERALLNNEHVKLYSFDGYKHTRIIDSERSVKSTLIMLNEDETTDCKVAIKKALKHLNRDEPTDLYERSLLKKDYSLVKDINELYAVGHFTDSGRLGLSGHTAVICEMFVDKILNDKDFTDIKHTIYLPLYFYNQDINHWFHIAYDPHYKTFKFVELWAVPRPRGLYGGCGSRELTMSAKAAINNL